jgi:glutaredoxin
VRRVVLYSRPGCHLCDAAREVVLAVRQRHPFLFDEVDIEGSDELVRDFGIRIPVVTVDGEEVFEIEVEGSRLAELVRM